MSNKLLVGLGEDLLSTNAHFVWQILEGLTELINPIEWDIEQQINTDGALETLVSCIEASFILEADLDANPLHFTIDQESQTDSRSLYESPRQYLTPDFKNTALPYPQVEGEYGKKLTQALFTSEEEDVQVYRDHAQDTNYQHRVTIEPITTDPVAIEPITADPLVSGPTSKLNPFMQNNISEEASPESFISNPLPPINSSKNALANPYPYARFVDEPMQTIADTGDSQDQTDQDQVQNRPILEQQAIKFGGLSDFVKTIQAEDKKPIKQNPSAADASTIITKKEAENTPMSSTSFLRPEQEQTQMERSNPLQVLSEKNSTADFEVEELFDSLTQYINQEYQRHYGN